MPPYQKDFEPIALPGEYIKIYKKNTEGKYYKVIALEPLPALTYDFGALNAGQSIEKEVDALYVNENQLAQYRMMLIDDIQLYIKQPSSSARFATQTGQFKITRDIAGSDFVNLTEFYILEGKDTSKTVFVVENPSPTNNLTTSRVLFAGYKFLLEEVEKEPEKYTTIALDSLD